LVIFRGNGGVECFDHLIAQRTIQVEMQLYFGPGGGGRGLTWH
jgi:hypothetical protein